MHKWIHTTFVFLGLGNLFQDDFFLVPYICLQIPFFNGWVTLPCIKITYFLYVFFCWEISRLSPVSGCCNTGTEQQCTWLSKCLCFRMEHLLVINSRMVELDLGVAWFPFSWGTSALISIVAVQAFSSGWVFWLGFLYSSYGDLLAWLVPFHSGYHPCAQFIPKDDLSLPIKWAKVMRRAKESSSHGLSFTPCPRRAEGDVGIVLAACHSQRSGSAFPSQGHFISKTSELQVQWN